MFRCLDQRDYADLNEFFDVDRRRHPAVNVPGDFAHQIHVSARQHLRVGGGGRPPIGHRRLARVVQRHYRTSLGIAAGRVMPPPLESMAPPRPCPPPPPPPPPSPPGTPGNRGAAPPGQAAPGDRPAGGAPAGALSPP